MVEAARAKKGLNSDLCLPTVGQSNTIVDTLSQPPVVIETKVLENPVALSLYENCTIVFLAVKNYLFSCIF